MSELTIDDVQPGPEVRCGDHDPPLTRIVAAQLRRRAADPVAGRHMRRLRGTVALCSTTDPQAATMRFDRGTVTVRPGGDERASLVIAGDLSTSGVPEAAALQVTGALRHPVLAWRVGRLLAPPPPAQWRAVVRSTWDRLGQDDALPDSMRLVCTDRCEELTLGFTGPPAVELHGPAWAIIKVFSGDDHLAEAVEAGRLQVVATFPAVSVLSGALLRFGLTADLVGR